MSHGVGAHVRKQNGCIEGIEAAHGIQRKRVLEALFRVPGLFQYGSPEEFSITETRTSGVRVNVKEMWGLPLLMSGVVELMQLAVQDKTIHTVVGIESGGSPFAAQLAARLPAGLRLIRKNESGIKSLVAGPSADAAGNVLVVDDVLGRGDSLSRTLSAIDMVADEVTFLSVFSYGMQRQLSERLGVAVRSLYGVNELVEYIPRSDEIVLARSALEAYQNKIGVIHE